VAVVAAWPASKSEPTASAEPLDGVATTEESAIELPMNEDAPAKREARPVVYTARYRLTLKGPDRGKWEASVVAEADAPLITVDAVVRGVQRRSGDADGATRMEGDDVRAILAAKTA
jgi:hypothetical protein